MSNEPTGASPATLAHQLAERERRVAVRYSCTLSTLCQTGTAGPEDFWWRGELRDISTTGVGLLIRRRFEPGTQLVIEAITKEEAIQPLVVRVMRATRQAEGSWLLGCEFARAEDGEMEDMAPVLRTLRATAPDCFDVP